MDPGTGGTCLHCQSAVADGLASLSEPEVDCWLVLIYVSVPSVLSDPLSLEPILADSCRVACEASIRGGVRRSALGLRARCTGWMRTVP
jgi:hypothetical protein